MQLVCICLLLTQKTNPSTNKQVLDIIYAKLYVNPRTCHITVDNCGTQDSSHDLPSYPPDRHHCSHVVYQRAEGNFINKAFQLYCV